MTYVMHGTPSGTPLASPRDAVPEGDLEAPLLPRPAKQRQHFAPDGGGLLKAGVFGLINTAAGIVSGGGWHAAVKYN